MVPLPILVEHARAQRAAKRGGGASVLTLDEALDRAQPMSFDILQLDDALNGLAHLDQPQSRIVELRFFTGLSIDETAQVMSISPATVSREWTTTRAWLHWEMTGARGAP